MASILFPEVFPAPFHPCLSVVRFWFSDLDGDGLRCGFRLLVLAALAASFAPTRRIAKIDPASTLRAE
jgi:hypothetical protein